MMAAADSKKQAIDNGAFLGIEFGSTRIKASLVTSDGTHLASGAYNWENHKDGEYWSYNLDQTLSGAAEACAELKAVLAREYGCGLECVSALGVSAMMHGYLAFDSQDQLLVPFRTWRNNCTGPASEALTRLFEYPIPQRWSIAHLYQAVLNKEPHLEDLSFFTTLAGYVHWRLCGEKVLGAGDASGMFPVDPATLQYNSQMLESFERLLAEKGQGFKLAELLPRILPAGELAGSLSAQGASLLDPEGSLRAGTPLCPPEGDAGTGMVVTNSVRVRTGNVSAGTSVFAMIVLEKALSRAHEELDLVLTPDGKEVAMVHSNNCSSDLDAWMDFFAQTCAAAGAAVEKADLYGRLLPLALQGEEDCNGMLAISYVSGEHITGFEEGRPLVVRRPDREFLLPDFMRSLLFSAFGALRTGLDILFEEEGVHVDEIRGHGGIFKTPEVALRILSAAMNTAVSIPETAGEGGSYGMAVLAAYMQRQERGLSLPDYLDTLMQGRIGPARKPDPVDVRGFKSYLQRYHAGLEIERAAIRAL